MLNSAWRWRAAGLGLGVSFSHPGFSNSDRHKAGLGQGLGGRVALQHRAGHGPDQSMGLLLAARAGRPL